MRRHIAVVLTAAATAVLMLSATAGAQTAEQWLSRVDENLVLESARYRATMIVHLPSGRERTFVMDCKVQSDQYALIEYVEPKRDAGTRYLKRDDNLWVYFPRVDRTMLIQGHMLRQGVQGGDMSYEDLTESASWRDQYTAEIVEQSADTVVIEMAAKDMSVSYPYRRVVIEKATALPVRTVNYDASRQPIKRDEMLEFKRFGDRYFPVATRIVSLITEDKWTRFEMSEIEFDQEFDPSTFTKRGLVR